MIIAKPLIRPFRIQPLLLKQRPKKGGFMTLAAAFRCPKGGILLCSDQEWNDAGSKRSINKNYRIGNLESCEFFISGAGPDIPISRAWEEIHNALAQAERNGIDLVVGHREIIELTLQTVHKMFAKLLKNYPMNLLVICAPRSLNRVPMLYRSDGAALDHASFYYAVGSGKPIADYLADRLYEHGKLSKQELATLAAFILREAGDSSIGVGMGANMIFIHEGEKVMHFISPGVIKEMQDGIPNLADAIRSYWSGRLNFPDWYAS